MAYSPSVAEAFKILDSGIAASPSSGAAITKGGSIFRYCSSHAATEITGAGFFTGCGAQRYHSSGTAPYGSIGRSTNNIGMRPGDLLVNVESSAGATPGRATWHAITGTTLGAIGYDATVSAHAST